MCSRKGNRLQVAAEADGFALDDDLVHVLNLRLGAAEGAELHIVRRCFQQKQALENSHLLLRELTRALILAVAEEFDDAAFIGSKAVGAC